MELKISLLAPKSPPTVTFLSQFNPIRTIPNYACKIRFNITLQSTLRSFGWSFPFRFSDQNFELISHLPYTRYKPRPCGRLLFYNSNNIWQRVRVVRLSDGHNKPRSGTKVMHPSFSQKMGLQ